MGSRVAKRRAIGKRGVRGASVGAGTTLLGAEICGCGGVREARRAVAKQRASEYQRSFAGRAKEKEGSAMKKLTYIRRG